MPRTATKVVHDDACIEQSTISDTLYNLTDMLDQLPDGWHFEGKACEYHS